MTRSTSGTGTLSDVAVWIPVLFLAASSASRPSAL
jgi:hypothetical protein